MSSNLQLSKSHADLENYVKITKSYHFFRHYSNAVMYAGRSDLNPSIDSGNKFENHWSTVTLKMRSRSLKSDQFFAVPVRYLSKFDLNPSIQYWFR